MPASPSALRRYVRVPLIIALLTVAVAVARPLHAVAGSDAVPAMITVAQSDPTPTEPTAPEGDDTPATPDPMPVEDVLSTVNPLGLTGVPVGIVVPSLGVRAQIQAFDLNPDLTMPVPQQAALVAWYSFGAAAGGNGNAVLAGHRDWDRQKGIFYDLGRLDESDDIWLLDGAGVWYLYRVVWARSIPESTADVSLVAGYTGRPSVTLITCSGTFDRAAGLYVDRHVVRGELVTVIPPDPDSR